MCFSAIASFVAAAVTGAAGLAALSKIRHRTEAPLAAMPLLFATQQAIEGVLWLILPNGAWSSDLIFAYLMFSQVIWPTFAPLSVLMAEPVAGRRKGMAPFVALGLAVSAYLMWRISTHPYDAALMDDHIAFHTGQTHIMILVPLYLTAVVAPMFLSSARTIAAMGLVLFVGAVATWWAAAHAFQSVWCFFSALASTLVAVHFWRRKN